MSSRKGALGKSKEETEVGIRVDDIIIIIVIVAFALSIGSVGYYYTTNLSLLNSFYNASLILSGMGPANTITTVPGRYFASFYALFSGFIFIVVISIFLQRILVAELN